MFVRIFIILVAINLAVARHTQHEGQTVQKERRSPAVEENHHLASAGTPAEKSIAGPEVVLWRSEGNTNADARSDSTSGSEKTTNDEKSDKSRRSVGKAGCCG